MTKEKQDRLILNLGLVNQTQIAQISQSLCISLNIYLNKVYRVNIKCKGRSSASFLDLYIKM